MSFVELEIKLGRDSCREIRQGDVKVDFNAFSTTDRNLLNYFYHALSMNQAIINQS